MDSSVSVTFSYRHFWYIFSTKVNSIIIFVHCCSPEGDVVPGAELHSHHTPASGGHHAIVAVGAVFCLLVLVTIDVEPGVIIPAIH